MRRINSEFQTVNMSEEGQKLSNRDYFGYVEMDDFACYVLADSLDGDSSINSAKLVVETGVVAVCLCGYVLPQNPQVSSSVAAFHFIVQSLFSIRGI